MREQEVRKVKELKSPQREHANPDAAKKDGSTLQRREP